MGIRTCSHSRRRNEQYYNHFVQVPPEEFCEDIFSNAAEAEVNGPASETGNQNSKGEEKPKLVHLQIMTHRTLISKGSVNDFRSR